MKSNIVLIGFMATGKSTVGRKLAQNLDMDFLEMDEMIEKKAGKSIPKIFKEDGEIRFRELEMSVCKDLSNSKNSVISAGGGVVLNKLNIDYLKISSKIILLEATADEIYERAIKEGKEKRPLIDKPNPRKEVNDLLEFRKPFYEAASQYQVQTDDKDTSEIVDEIINLLKINE